jgi:hypothetical protein
VWGVLSESEVRRSPLQAGWYSERNLVPHRFNRKEYAPIEIVQTEKKGFGLRAQADIRKCAHFLLAHYDHCESVCTPRRDQFIYEYVGDVVSHPSFKKRMREYAQEGIRHFYFMMLQKDEYIDATKRGGIGRFANHSCSPNCYVAKWTVDQHVRMGIFASRNIRKDEELTFNYNVDRYGCAEPSNIYRSSAQFCVVMTRNPVTVASRIVSGFSEARRRPTSEPWTTCTLTVSFSVLVVIACSQSPVPSARNHRRSGETWSQRHKEEERSEAR